MDNQTERTSTQSIEKIDETNCFIVVTTVEKRKMTNEDAKLFLQRQQTALEARAVKTAQLQADKAAEVAANLKLIGK